MALTLPTTIQDFIRETEWEVGGASLTWMDIALNFFQQRFANTRQQAMRKMR